MRKSFIKVSRCEITELLQDIWLWLASTTHLPPCCYFGYFEKKKCWSLKLYVLMYLQVFNVKLQQILLEKLGSDCSVPKFWRKNMSEINMIEMRSKKIESKPLKNRRRASYNHHAWKFDTWQKLDIIGAAEFDSTTVLYFLVNLVASIWQN